ncbi:MAG: hypothetical protein M1820_008849 [Bogoriella megaspora]|nr:MAG: hypothetical protein M1820_008849 [Bogoriella megaspora]
MVNRAWNAWRAFSAICVVLIFITCFDRISRNAASPASDAVGFVTSKSRRVFHALTDQGARQGPSPNDTTTDIETNKTVSLSDTIAFDAGPLTFSRSNCSADLIIPHFKSEDLTWLAQLPLVINPIVYTNSAFPSSYGFVTRHVSSTKGHEALTYITHITNSYYSLPSILIFMHPHEIAWHNNDLLSHSALILLSRLNPYHILRQGYVNLRCHWDPGCPSYLHPSTPDQDLKPGSDALRQEEPLVANAWSMLFPGEEAPTNLAQPCCAQFAVSKEQILSHPLSRYKGIQSWLESTTLDDRMSGRVLEYVWQYLFTGDSVHCPNMRSCYCKMYGVCFGSEERWQGWFERRWYLRKHIRELEALALKQPGGVGTALQRAEETVREETMQLERVEWLEMEVRRLEEETNIGKREAWERGRDPVMRDIE